MRRRLFLVAFGALLVPVPAAAEEFRATHAETSAYLLADGDRNKVLDRREFRLFVDAMAAGGQSTARTIRAFGAYELAFRIADANRDGVLSPVELRSADDGYRSAPPERQDR